MPSRTNSGVATVLLLALAILHAACGGPEGESEQASRLTQAERDSVLAKSILPGAAAVGRALEVADSANVRTARIDASIP
jgi:hypothetical protein